MILWDWFFRMQRRKKRAAILNAALAWPTAVAKLLPGVVVDRDELAEGTVAQDRQAEFPYYFTLESGFFGGHVRSVPCSESEARRMMKVVVEGTLVTVRYNPSNPDEGCVLSSDNAGMEFAAWSS